MQSKNKLQTSKLGMEDLNVPTSTCGSSPTVQQLLSVIPWSQTNANHPTHKQKKHTQKKNRRKQKQVTTLIVFVGFPFIEFLQKDENKLLSPNSVIIALLHPPKTFATFPALHLLFNFHPFLRLLLNCLPQVPGERKLWRNQEWNPTTQSGWITG